LEISCFKNAADLPLAAAKICWGHIESVKNVLFYPPGSFVTGEGGRNTRKRKERVRDGKA
jgi:hypothetical protein